MTIQAPTIRPGGQSPQDSLAELRAVVARHRRLVVAFSGGVDSALVAYLANDVLGPENTLVATAVSPSLSAGERSGCAELASQWGLRWIEIETDEMESAAYTRNEADRCYWCKDALMRSLSPLAAAEDAAIALGVNLDDLGDHRPGQLAAARADAVFPLVEAGLDKPAVRAVSSLLGLRTASKPAAACLASRIPYGTPVTVEVLGRVERAEAALRWLGFDELRVRHYGETARIEVPVPRLGDVLALREQVVEAVRSAGYGYVTIDLEGLRSGNLNQSIGR